MIRQVGFLCALNDSRFGVNEHIRQFRDYAYEITSEVHRLSHQSFDDVAFQLETGALGEFLEFVPSVVSDVLLLEVSSPAILKPNRERDVPRRVK